MAETINGTPVNFSFASAAGATLTGSADDGTTFSSIAGILMQRADEKKQSNRTLVKDGLGDRTTSIHNDRVNAASLTWVVSGSNLAAAITNSTLSRPGNFIRITACATMPDLAHATNLWEIISCNLTGSNDSVKEITYELEYSAGIQSRAS
jgi:hypothetical protein